MEEMYWKHFTETGDVTDYLGYKMEVYGHGGGVSSVNGVGGVSTKKPETEGESRESGKLTKETYQNKQE